VHVVLQRVVDVEALPVHAEVPRDARGLLEAQRAQLVVRVAVHAAVALAPTPAPTEPPADQSQRIPSISTLVDRVRAKVRDADRRKRCVIVSGLHSDPNCADSDIFLSLCTDYLNLKPYVSPSGCQRLGIHNNSAPQKLRVTLLSEHAASELLLAAKRLRDADNQYVANNIYINRDLTVEQSKAAFLKRQQLRKARYDADFPDRSMSPIIRDNELQSIGHSTAQHSRPLPSPGVVAIAAPVVQALNNKPDFPSTTAVVHDLQPDVTTNAD